MALLAERAGPNLFIGTQLTSSYPPEHPLGFRYSLYNLALLLVMAAGAGAGLLRGIPIWSYTWIVLGIVSILILISALLPVIMADTLGFAGVTTGWLFTSPFLGGGLLVLLFAASRVRQGLTHVFFATAVYLAFLGLWASIASAHIFASETQAVAAILIALIATAVTLAVVISMVMSFIYGDASARRLSVYGLVAVALLAPLMTGWLVRVMVFPDPAPNGLAMALMKQVLFRWAVVVAALMITWALAHWFIKIGKIPAASAASSGEPHAR